MGCTIGMGNLTDYLNCKKRAIRIISQSKYNAHSSFIFQNLNLLKLKDLCALHDYTFCYKLYNRVLPDYFQMNMNQRLLDESRHNYLTRQGSKFRLPAVRHEFVKNSISYKYPFVLNNMPVSLQPTVCLALNIISKS